MTTSNDVIVDEEWKRIEGEMKRLTTDEMVLKKRLDFPHATVRKIMNSEIIADRALRRSEENMKEPIKFFISKETTVTLALACEFFVREVAIRSWGHTSTNARKTLQKVDVYAGVNDNDMFDFLIDKIPRMTNPTNTTSTTTPEAMVATAATYCPPAPPQEQTQEQPSVEQDVKEEKGSTSNEGDTT